MARISIDLLRKVSFFRELPADSLERIADRTVRRRVPAGCILFRKGENARGVYLLVKGKVEIYRTTAEGREQVLHAEVPVRSVAELPIFDGGPYPASGRTAEDSELYFLSLDDFQRLYREHSEIADALIRNLGQRLRALVKVLERVSLKTVPQRVAASLLERADAAGARRPGGVFLIGGTQSDLAHELATSRESVARALADLRRRGLIRQKGSRVEVLDPLGLERVAQGEEGGLPR